MSSLIDNIGYFSTHVIIPFLDAFFTQSIGIMFVGCAVVLVVVGVLLRLFRTKF